MEVLRNRPVRIVLSGIFILFKTAWVSVAQPVTDTADMIRYTPDFKFRDGVFLSYEQVRNDNPIPQSGIITTVDYSDREFYTKVLAEKTIRYYDRYGMKQESETENIWGFSRNGILYISLNQNYHRITVVGSICHFVATVTTYDTRYYDPYYASPYDYNYRYGGGYPVNTASNELRQYIFDFEQGRIYEYNYQALEVLLMKDPQLHDEYAQLRKKKKRQLKFLYLRRFNERNPLYIPRN